MATYVNNLRLKEIATGDEEGTWGASTNTNLELIADAFGSGTEAITTNSNTHTTTIADGAADEGRAMFLKYTGDLDSDCTITIAPNTVNKLWFIENATGDSGSSGPYNIIISQGSGANITIGNGKVAAVFTDGAGSGAAVLDAFADLELMTSLTVGTDAIVGDDLTLKSDGAVLGFGADTDVTLTHVADTGLLLNSTRQLQFFDSSQRIAASSATVMTIGATDEIDLAATLLDLNGNVDVSGTLTAAGNADLNGDLDVDGTTNLDAVDIDGAVQIDSTVTVGVDDTGYDVKFFGDTASAYMLWDTSTDDLVLAGAAGIDLAGDLDVDGTTNLDVVDIDGAVDMASTLTLAGNADFNGDLDVDGTTNLDVVDIDGAVDMASTLQVDGAITGSSTIQGTTITATTAFVPDASDGAALGTSSLEFSDLFLADGAQIAFGDDQEVTLTHVADTGLLLSDDSGIGTTQLQFGDSGTYIHQSADGVLDLVADTEIEINATTIDMNGAVDLSSTITVAGNADLNGDLDVEGATNLDNTDVDGTLVVDGSNISLDSTSTLNIDNSNTSNGITIGTATSGVPISIGHTTSEVTVNDNLTVTGTLTLGSGAELTEAELEMLDGITAGTVAASKAVVVDSNKDIGTFRNLTIDGVFTDGNYTFDTSGNVTGLGTVASGAITSSGVVTGTGFTIGSAVINEAELETIDGVTAGTVAASKAVVVDSNKDIASFRNITLTGELDAATLDVSGAIDVAGTANLDVVDIDGAVDMASTLQVDGAITGSSTIQGTTITATTAFVPDASDGAALGTTSLEFSDLYLADGAVAAFGDDQDVTLTHVADTGLLLNSTMALQFNDASQYINAPSNTVLDINATDEIELNATAVDLNGTLDVSGATTLGADLSVPATSKIFLDGGSNTYIHESSGDTMRFFCGGTSRFQIQADGVMIPSGNNLFLDNGGDTYIVEGSANVMRFFAGGSKQFEVSGTNMSVVGALSKGSGSFKIDHPLDSMKDTHDLVHSFIEGPRADLIYRGSVQLSEGTATVDLDDAATMTNGTWELLCRDPQVWVQNQDGWTQVRGSVSGSTLTITAQDNDCTDTVSWLVVAERQDEHMMDTNWTDNNGRVIVEPEKPAEDEDDGE